MPSRRHHCVERQLDVSVSIAVGEIVEVCRFRGHASAIEDALKLGFVKLRSGTPGIGARLSGRLQDRARSLHQRRIRHAARVLCQRRSPLLVQQQRLPLTPRDDDLAAADVFLKARVRAIPRTLILPLRPTLSRTLAFTSEHAGLRFSRKA